MDTVTLSLIDPNCGTMASTVFRLIYFLFLMAYWLQHNDGTIPWNQGAVSIRKTVLPGVAIPMLKIRRPNGRLIFNIGIAIPR